MNVAKSVIISLLQQISDKRLNVFCVFFSELFCLKFMAFDDFEINRKGPTTCALVVVVVVIVFVVVCSDLTDLNFVFAECYTQTTTKIKPFR